MESTLPSTAAAHDDRGAFVVIGASPYVAYAVHGTPAYLTRATHNPDGSITLQPVGAPFARLDLAVDAGRWRAQRPRQQRLDLRPVAGWPAARLRHRPALRPRGARPTTRWRSCWASTSPTKTSRSTSRYVRGSPPGSTGSSRAHRPRRYRC